MKRYRETAAGNTANQGRLLMAFYASGVRFLRDGATAFAQRRTEEGREQVAKAQRLVRELRNALDLTGGGDVAHRLDGIYDDFSHRLVVASAALDGQALIEVAASLDALAGAFRQALSQVSPGSIEH